MTTVVGRRRGGAEEGFTLVEMVVATTLLASSLLALAHLMYGSISSLGAVRQRSVFLERATEEMESLRALPWEEIGVSIADPNYLTAYPGGSYDGRAAVAAANGPAAVTSHTSPEPHTVRRWVTVGPEGPGVNLPRRLDVVVEWPDEDGAIRSVRLTSVRYPGGLGAGEQGNGPAITAATASPSSVTAGVTSVQFAAAASDPDGDTMSYAWDFGDGTSSTGATVSHVYAAPGSYTATVTVTDGHGGSAAMPVDVTVVSAGSNLPPTAVITATTATSGTAPLSVNFDGSGSSDPEHGALTYRWNWGDGTPDGVGVSATHVYTGADTYTVTLVVTDEANGTGQATEFVQTNPLNCDVTDGYFQNPSPKARNLITLNGNSGKPSSTKFDVRATSNSACGTLTARIPYSGGTLQIPLHHVGTNANGEWTWEATHLEHTDARFNVGTYQTGELIGTGPNPQTDRLQLDFQVKK